jgi:hypothetical protein
MRKNTKKLTALCICLVGFLAGCGGGGGGTAPAGGSSSPKLVSIAVTPADPFIAKDFDCQMTATGTYSDASTRDITASVTWSSSDAAKIAVGQTNGLASFVKVGGPVTITAIDSATNVQGSVTVPERNVLFVTSVTGTANLGTWPDAGGLTGLAAGDAICQARAAAAGLGGTFVAWLSDSANDAYCRATGHSGTEANNCGQPGLPTNAGPWIRTDGYPFSGTISAITSTNPPIYAPVSYNEYGVPAATGNYYFTATNAAGVLYTSGTISSCNDWNSQSSAGSAVGGMTLGTTFYWTYGPVIGCGSAEPLLCMQTGAGAALPVFASAGKKVFVTSAGYNGNLGGLTGADEKCRSAAQAAGLADFANYKAWLSDSATDAVSRLTSTGPWVRLDGVKLADTKSDLADGSLFTSIVLTENMEYIAGSAVSWTGSKSTGLKDANVCSDWTDGTTAAKGLGGVANKTDHSWTDFGAFSCNLQMSLYCFED